MSDNFIRLLGYCDQCGCVMTNQMPSFAHYDKQKAWMFCSVECKMVMLTERRLLGKVTDDVGKAL